MGFEFGLLKCVVETQGMVRTARVVSAVTLFSIRFAGTEPFINASFTAVLPNRI